MFPSKKSKPTSMSLYYISIIPKGYCWFGFSSWWCLQITYQALTLHGYVAYSKSNHSNNFDDAFKLVIVSYICTYCLVFWCQLNQMGNFGYKCVTWKNMTFFCSFYYGIRDTGFSRTFRWGNLPARTIFCSNDFRGKTIWSQRHNRFGGRNSLYYSILKKKLIYRK